MKKSNDPVFLQSAGNSDKKGFYDKARFDHARYQ